MELSSYRRTFHKIDKNGESKIILAVLAVVVLSGFLYLTKCCLQALVRLVQPQTLVYNPNVYISHL